MNSIKLLHTLWVTFSTCKLQLDKKFYIQHFQFICSFYYGFLVGFYFIQFFFIFATFFFVCCNALYNSLELYKRNSLSSQQYSYLQVLFLLFLLLVFSSCWLLVLLQHHQQQHHQQLWLLLLQWKQLNAASIHIIVQLLVVLVAVSQ